MRLPRVFIRTLALIAGVGHVGVGILVLRIQIVPMVHGVLQTEHIWITTLSPTGARLKYRLSDSECALPIFINLACMYF